MMPLELTLTAKGQARLRRGVLDHFRVKAGKRVKVSLLPDGRMVLTAASEGIDIRSLSGALRRPGQRVISLQEMQGAIELATSRYKCYCRHLTRDAGEQAIEAATIL